jgi:hypothetical protein
MLAQERIERFAYEPGNYNAEYPQGIGSEAT